MTFQQWLDSAIYPEQAVLVRERLAELIYRNGSLRVTSWGVMQGGGLYGEIGLDQDEALELIHLGGMVAGFKLAFGPEVEPTLTAVMRAEWAKKEVV